MDPPRTRRETKKDPKVKAQGKTIYSAKHIRQQEARSGRGGSSASSSAAGARS